MTDARLSKEQRARLERSASGHGNLFGSVVCEDLRTLLADYDVIGEALEPFAKLAGRVTYLEDNEPVWLHTAKGTFGQPKEDDLSAGHFRKAHRALAASPPPPVQAGEADEGDEDV